MISTAARRTIIFAGLALAACATLEQLVEAPGVSLSRVKAEELGFDRQVFLLSVDVANPNPFPLPLTAMRYGIEFDGLRFAGGEMATGVRVPAGSETSFGIRVETNLVDTVPDLLFVLNEGRGRTLPYSLHGEFDTGIPNAAPVRFATRGEVRLLGD